MAGRLSVRVIGVSTALWLAVACSASGSDPVAGPGALQSQCVIDQLNLERTLADGQACDNWGYSDCSGFGSECINYCAFDFCQPEPCETAEDCNAFFGELGGAETWACEEYVVSSKGYGTWCTPVEHCPEGTVGCPCLPGDACGPDPWGEGNMTCEAGICESSCPSACIQGSVCCGGAFCSGNCIGTPCCS
jgi:hypothetical protein